MMIIMNNDFMTQIIKGIVHPQKIIYKYIILKTVTKNSTIIITLS